MTRHKNLRVGLDLQAELASIIELVTIMNEDIFSVAFLGKFYEDNLH